MTTLLLCYFCGVVASMAVLFDHEEVYFHWKTLIVCAVWPFVAVYSLVSIPFLYKWGFDFWRFSVGGLPGLCVGVTVRAFGRDWCAGFALHRLQYAHHLGPLFVGVVR